MTPIRSIRAKCLDCSGGDMVAVRNCQSATCSLHAFRMGKSGRTTLIYIRSYCLWCCLESRALVKACASASCALWQYRFGTRPKKCPSFAEIGSTEAVLEYELVSVDSHA